ncbi:MAG: hypothetical protein ACRETB_13635 [Steroidobacteraceae bacterium]
MSARRARYLAHRQELLELEADVQRAALAATFARWEQRRMLGWAAEGGRMLLRTLSSPRVRWLAIGAALRAFKHQKR